MAAPCSAAVFCLSRRCPKFHFSSCKAELSRRIAYPFVNSFKKCSTDAVCTETSVDNNKGHSKFEILVRERRRQVKNSVLIHIYSRHVIAKLYNHCQKYGNITRAYNYSLNNDKDFALLEFENEEGVHRLFSDVRHFDHSNIIPVKSRCLWYHETQQTKDETIPAPFKVNGPPSDIEILQKLQLADSVTNQMELIHEMLNLSELGQLLRFFICQQLEMAFNGIFTNCTVLPFGSCVNGFGKFNCDLDMVLSLGDVEHSNTVPSKLFFHTKRSLTNSRVQVQRHLEILSDIISNFFPGCSNVQRILQARVPIVKFHHDLVDTDCDLTLNNLSGVYMSELLYLYGEADHRVRPLVFTILNWAKHHGLTHDSPGRWITNFSLILMAILFLQARPTPVLPSLGQLQTLADKSHQRSSEGVNCTFLRDLNRFPKMHNQEELSYLLLEFFTYYAKFDFKQRGLSLTLGKDMTKPDYSALYIQNPFEAELNVSKNVTSDEILRIQDKMKAAAWKLETATRPTGNGSWGLLELFDMDVGGKSPKKYFPVSAFFANKSSEYLSLQEVDSLSVDVRGTASDASSDSSAPLNPRAYEKRKSFSRRDLVSQLELDKFMHDHMRKSKTKRQLRLQKKAVPKSQKHKIHYKPWTF